jgi:hypothetical protein
MFIMLVLIACSQAFLKISTLVAVHRSKVLTLIRPALFSLTEQVNKGVYYITVTNSPLCSLYHIIAPFQLQRQFHHHPQMNVMHAQNLAFQQQLQQQQQQQLQQLRRNASNANQISSPRGSVMMMDPKTHHSLADVKIENTIDAQMDAQSGFGSALNQRQQQLQQMRLQHQHQQQMMMGGNHLVQSNNSNNSLIQGGMQQQFKTMQSVQMSQLQAQYVLF